MPNSSILNPEPRKIRPIIIYPFKQPTSLDSLELLFNSIDELIEKDKPEVYEKALVIIDNRTISNPNEFAIYTKFAKNYQKNFKFLVERYDDTCSMWLRGFALSIDESEDSNRQHDIFWLIPGDFAYSTHPNSLIKMKELPLNIYSNECDLSLGEIKVPLTSAKQLIDMYGTYGLMYNWFPVETKTILEQITTKPRTEFFAIKQGFLRRVLRERWYPYEQTIAILLQNMNGNRPFLPVKKIELGEIIDDESGRNVLAGAMQQIERTERLLKLFWREKMLRLELNWQNDFRQLDKQSEEIRGAAMTIMQNVLT